jgi:hypothetical protein
MAWIKVFADSVSKRLIDIDDEALDAVRLQRF